MKKILSLIILILLCNHLAIAQKKYLSKIDSVLLNFNKHSTIKLPKNLNFIQPNLFKKKSSINRDLSFIKSNEILNNPLRSINSNKNKMPVFIPKGNFKTKLFEIDTTKLYSLRNVKPNY